MKWIKIELKFDEEELDFFPSESQYLMYYKGIVKTK